MSLAPPVGPFADPVTRVLTLPLAALRASLADAAPITKGMPAASVALPRLNLVAGATPIDPPMFRDVICQVARNTGHDVMLVRTGLHPETLDPVRVEVAINAGGETLIFADLAFYRHGSGELWLVPPHRGVYLEFTEDGLCLQTIPPFTTIHERGDGLCRAASEIVRLSRRRRAR